MDGGKDEAIFPRFAQVEPVVVCNAGCNTRNHSAGSYVEKMKASSQVALTREFAGRCAKISEQRLHVNMKEES